MIMLMNKFTLMKVGLTLVCATLLCTGTFAQKKTLKLRKGADAESVMIGGRRLAKVCKAPASSAGTSTGVSTLAKSPKKTTWTNGTTVSDILIDEDFSAFTAGTENKPDTNMIASYYGTPGMYINPSLTAQSTWSGNNVYMAGGKVALVSPNEYSGSDLSTPLGDYSGDITITFKVKALVNSDLFVNILKGGYAACDDADTKDGDNTESYRLYASQGWKEVTLRFSNLSADNDGFIQFHNYGTIIIDNVKVTTTPDFIAAPTLLSPTDFTKTSFTANWEPVRMAYNYYLDLYKKVYTSEQDAAYSEGFESMGEDGSNAPKDFTIVQNGATKVGATAGADSTKGLILTNNDTLTTPFNYSKYKSLNLWVRVYDPDPDNNEAIYEADVKIEVKTSAGWQYYGDFDVSSLFDGDSINLGKSLKSLSYYAVRFTVTKLPAGDYVVFDNINLTTGRPATLEEVAGDYPGYFYATTKNCSYTFTDLDPLSDYYYSVRSHNVFMYSDRNPVFAFGVSVPTPTSATDITSSGYTANWETAPKATRYRVYNYGVNTIDKDEKGHTVMEEDFSKIDASVTTSTDPYNPEAVGNEDFTSLDDYTSLPGWGGIGTTLSQGMVGAEATSSVVNYVRTPMMYLDNADSYKVKIKAYGTPDDALMIRTNDKEYAVYFKQNGDDKTKGVIDGEYEIPLRSKHETVFFYSYGKKAFILDYVKFSQDVTAGSKVYDFLGYKEVTADQLNGAFDGLDKYSYADYAFTTKAYYDFEGDVAVSDMSDFFPVKASTTGIGTAKTDADVTEKARYTVDGIKVSAPRKGLNIVKMSDGSVRKIIIK